MDENEKRITITQLGELLGVHFNTIRQWEKQFDIIVPRSKDTQRSRYYTEKEINIFTKIRDLRQENMSIDNIKRYLNRDLDLIEQEETAIQSLPFSEVTISKSDSTQIALLAVSAETPCWLAREERAYIFSPTLYSSLTILDAISIAICWYRGIDILFFILSCICL